MVVINGVKYACDRCIRGHRVSGCRHIDEPLRMIKRKGRPPTQAAASKRHKATPNGFLALKEPDGDGSGTWSSDTRPDSVQDGDSFLKPEITPDELAELRENPHVKIILPDGSVLGPQSAEGERYTPTQQLYLSEQHRVSSHPIYFHPPEGQYLPPPPLLGHETDYYYPERMRYPTQVYGRPGPYTADLYNDAAGNNQAAALMNARGMGAYIPSTGSVSVHPKVTIEHELAASSQDLADSLTGIPPPNNSKRSSENGEGEASLESSDPYALATHMPKLSNLY